MTISSYRGFIRGSFVSLLVLLISSAVLVYAISPRRNPGFVPTSSNAGTHVGWAASIPESTWTWGSIIVAVVLAINIVLLIVTMPSARRYWTRGRQTMTTSRVGAVITGIMVCGLVSYLLWGAMLWYLLTQSIVD